MFFCCCCGCKIFWCLEKRGGILKPQGSLEKNREERELLINNPDVAANSNLSKDNTKLKRVRQNVALQSIFKKMEENKQVLKFYKLFLLGGLFAILG